MAGAIDLFSGSKSITGANNFQVDKNPLNQLFEGVDDVIGKQAGAVGGSILSFVEQFVQKIIGDLMNAIMGLPVELLGLLEPLLVQSFQDISKFFGNVLDFLGGLNPLDELFSVATAAENFINGVLAETGLLPILDEAQHLTAAVLQPLIDAIAQAFGLGTDLNFSTLESALSSVVGGISAVGQGIINAICVALGAPPGPNYTLTDIIHYLEHIPQTVVTGFLGGASTLFDDLTSLVDNAVGAGGSSFPWNFPLSFGDGTNSLPEVGNAIAAAPGHAQQVIDAIVNVLTGSNVTGNSWSDLQNALRQIPGEFIGGQLSEDVLPNITAAVSTDIAALQANFQSLFGAVGGANAQIQDLVQHLADSAPISTIINVLGGSGSGLSGLENALQNIPAELISAVNPTNTAAWLTAGEQAIADQISMAVGQGTGAALHEISSALQSFPFNNLIGHPGAGGSGPVQDIVDTFTQALTNLPFVGNTLAHFANYFSGTIGTLVGYQPANPPLASVAGSTISNNETIANMAVTKPSFHAINPTGDAVFNIGTLTGSSLPTIAVTQNNSIIGFISTPSGANPNTPPSTWPQKQAVEWISTGFTGSITGLYVTIYSYDKTTGTLNRINTSPNLAAEIENAVNYYFYDIITNEPNYLPPGGSYFIPYCQTDIFAVELQIVGTGTYNVAGIQMPLPTHPTALPPQLGAQRTGSPVPAAPWTITSPDYSTNHVPWFSLTGSQGITQYTPSLTSFTTPGADAYTVPAWAAFLDVIIFPGGGGGGGGINAWGNGGQVGQPIKITLEIGSLTGPLASTPDHPSQIAIAVGAGGTAGKSQYYNYIETNALFSGQLGYSNFSVPGGDGQGSSISYISPTGTITRTTAGGSGGAAGGGSYQGAGTANEDFNGNTYYGGAPQTVAEVVTVGGDTMGTGANGNSPGGGGSGCYSGTGLSNHWYQAIDQFGDRIDYYVYGYASQQNAGAGAPGAVFILAYGQGAHPPTAGAYAPLQRQIPVAIPRASLR